MHRRSFLAALGLAAGTIGTGGLLSACSRGSGIPQGEPTLSVLNTSFETLTGESRRLNLVVYDANLGSLEGADVSLFLRDLDGQVRSGPHEGVYQGEVGDGTGGGGVYQAILPLTEPGTVEVVLVEGNRYGAAAINVIPPERAQAPVPGSDATPTPTPTTTDDRGFAFLCTQDPPCTMHEVSLDTALSEGRPIALLFATPRYCQTAVCAPAVQRLDELRADRDWGDVTFIHCEIFPDEEAAADIVVGEPVLEWGLPTEPWLFTIDTTGTIVDRLDGLILPSDMARLLEQIA